MIFRNVVFFFKWQVYNTYGDSPTNNTNKDFIFWIGFINQWATCKNIHAKLLDSPWNINLIRKNTWISHASANIFGIYCAQIRFKDVAGGWNAFEQTFTICGVECTWMCELQNVWQLWIAWITCTAWKENSNNGIHEIGVVGINKWKNYNHQRLIIVMNQLNVMNY